MEKSIKITNEKLLKIAGVVDLSGTLFVAAEGALYANDEQLEAINSLLENETALENKILTAKKEKLKASVDAAAEKERLRYITDGVGQSMTYTEKFNQAVDYSKKYAAHQADPKNVTAPVENEYPLLRASIGIDGSSMIEVAETVTYAFALWEKIGAAIEGIRLKAKAAIGDAKTEEEAQAVFASIKWPNALSA
ncbi:hypothetical protein H3V13_00760 [Bartonella sp. M0280]|uniref:hypothetical protein n=1 Tax=Bartonella apihabitans TaxID=2750929 RepID=UPI0018DE7DF7|nr:hypothetical protein [Bartonella apihabitans]MBI0166492.1 hypothetical protein [Bartonella apihabitans]